MYRLTNAVRPYPWGSRTAIADLTGKPVPSPGPEAELWMGAHPSAPSLLVTPDGERSLLAEIEADPHAHLGKQLAAEYSGRLPFLFKVLAAERSLSLQAHPTTAQARAGYAAEEERGIPLDAPYRNYSDASSKPELLVALEPCEVLCGFRSVPDMVEVLRGLELPQLGGAIDALQARPDAEGVREAVTGLLTLMDRERAELVNTVAGNAAKLGVDSDQKHAGAYSWAAALAEEYPGDLGVVISLLLNFVRLEPDEGVYLPAGNLHAYLRGVGVEIMANSDNVLRGGLTSKHVDVPELLRILDFAGGPAPIVRPEVLGADAGVDAGEEVWRTPTREFALSRRRLTRDAAATLDVAGPQIILVLDGDVTLTRSDAHGGPDDDGVLILRRGESAYLSASEGPVTASGSGTYVRATPGRRRT